MPYAPSGVHYEPGFTNGNELGAVVEDEFEELGATVPTGPLLVDEVLEPHGAMVALGQFLVRMFRARPHSL